MVLTASAQGPPPSARMGTSVTIAGGRVVGPGSGITHHVEAFDGPCLVDEDRAGRLAAPDSLRPSHTATGHAATATAPLTHSVSPATVTEPLTHAVSPAPVA